MEKWKHTLTLSCLYLAGSCILQISKHCCQLMILLKKTLRKTNWEFKIELFVVWVKYDCPCNLSISPGCKLQIRCTFVHLCMHLHKWDFSWLIIFIFIFLLKFWSFRGSQEGSKAKAQYQLHSQRPIEFKSEVIQSFRLQLRVLIKFPIRWNCWSSLFNHWRLSSVSFQPVGRLNFFKSFVDEKLL